ncbi:MAG: glycosyltransferase family 2 protein [Planctomycetota bacterium]
MLPSRDEEANLPRVVPDALRAAGEIARIVEVLIVDDGSRDRTHAIAGELAGADTRVRVLRHDASRGYGAALRTGFSAATSEWVFYTDSDGQFDLDDLRALPELLQDCDVVVGYRVRRQDPWLRCLGGWCWTRVVNVAFGLHLRDADCAFKIFPRAFLATTELSSTGALISAELVARARGRGLRVEQLAVRHRPRLFGKPSGAHPRVVARALRELFLLRARIRAAVSSRA